MVSSWFSCLVMSTTEAHFDERNLRYNCTTKVANVYDAFMYAFVDGISSVFVGLAWFGRASYNRCWAHWDPDCDRACAVCGFVGGLHGLFRPSVSTASRALRKDYGHTAGHCRDEQNRVVVDADETDSGM